MSISTGYPKEKKTKNKHKLEIWFVPRFLIEKELSTTATHFQGIYNSWTEDAPVGIIWTWGGGDDLSHMDYLTTQNLDEICNANVYEKWRLSRQQRPSTVTTPFWQITDISGLPGKRFHVHFMS